jgi:hypothetical protein
MTQTRNTSVKKTHRLMLSVLIIKRNLYIRHVHKMEFFILSRPESIHIMQRQLPSYVEVPLLKGLRNPKFT